MTWRAIPSRQLILGFWLAITVQIIAQPIKISATVTLLLLDSYGVPVDFKIDSFRDVKSGIELAGRFKGRTLTEVLLGRSYLCRLSPLPPEKRFMRIEQTILVTNENMVVPLVTETGALPSTGPPSRTKFVIRPSPVLDDKLVWVSVRPAFGAGPAFMRAEPEATVINRDGTFFLDGIHGGRYVITILRGGKIVKLVSMEIPLLGPRTPLEIRLE